MDLVGEKTSLLDDRNNNNKYNKSLVNEHKNKNSIKEFNAFDRILTKDVANKNLRDDIPTQNIGCELKMAKNTNSSRLKVEPMSVTLLNILGGKKQQKIKYTGLPVLIDTGCSDSLMRAC